MGMIWEAEREPEGGILCQIMIERGRETQTPSLIEDSVNLACMIPIRMIGPTNLVPEPVDIDKNEA